MKKRAARTALVFLSLILSATSSLAREAPVIADYVVPVPDSGVPAAIGYAQESGIPYGQGLVKNAYVGRTFIQPSQTIRQLGIRLKLNPLREVVRGKRLTAPIDLRGLPNGIYSVTAMADDGLRVWIGTYSQRGSESTTGAHDTRRVDSRPKMCSGSLPAGMVMRSVDITCCSWVKRSKPTASASVWIASVGIRRFR